MTWKVSNNTLSHACARACSAGLQNAKSCRQPGSPQLSGQARAAPNTRWYVPKLTILRVIFDTTHIAMKKKKRNSGGDDMFADDADSLFGDSGDLFSTGQPTPAKSTSPAQPTNASTSKMKGKLSPEKRLEKFNTLLQLVSDHTGVNPPARVAHKPEQVRKTAWQNLFGLAANEEQLVQVTELFPKWRESRREFTPRMADAFVRESTHHTF